MPVDAIRPPQPRPPMADGATAVGSGGGFFVRHNGVDAMFFVTDLQYGYKKIVIDPCLKQHLREITQAGLG